MEGQGEEPHSSVSEVQSTQSSQDAMRTRVLLFAEAVVKMVSPVLLALALRKVDLSSEESNWLRASISPIATFTMAFSILLMAMLWICLSKLVPRLERLQYTAFKLLVFLCAMLLMSLASVILILISMKYKLFAILASVPAVFMTFFWFWSLRCDWADDSSLHAMADWDQDLENSIDFSAAFTVLLFLGLERLALEVQQSSRQHEGAQHDHLESSLVLSFVTCVLGVAVMFVWTIAPLTKPKEMMVPMPGCIEASNVALALFVTGIVMWITWAPLEEYALWVIVPPFMTLVWWMYSKFSSGGDEDQSLTNNGSWPRQDGHIVDIDLGPVQLELANQENDQEGVQPSQHHSNLGEQPTIDNQIMSTQDGHVVDANEQEPMHDDQSQEMQQGQQQSAQPPQDDSVEQNQHRTVQDSLQAEVQQQQGEQDQTVSQNYQANSTDAQITSKGSTEAQTVLPSDTAEGKPPSLELTKFALAGFLAVSIPSISDGSLTIWTHAFILLTATSVVSALVWRLLAHRPSLSPPEATAANIASLVAHGFAMMALVPFAVMAGMNELLPVPNCSHG